MQNMNQNIKNDSRKSQHSEKEQKELQNSDDEDSKELQNIQVKVNNQQQQKQYLKFGQLFKISPYVKTYVNQLIRGRKQQTILAFRSKLWKHKVVLLSEFEVPLVFQISKIYESRNKKIMQFEVRFSYFIILIKVLNICPKDNLSFQLKNWINSGVYGAVYEVEINNIKYAVKKMALNKHSVYKDIMNAIEQYCIMKLCSALEIGPAFRSAFGFDLIITQDSILFSCEMGLSIYEYVRSVSNNHSEFEANFQKLEESLILMHSLGIIHNDIKPNNIIYSQQYNRFCFIDFGLSEVNQNPIGSLKKVKPRGSIYYCSQEMKKLFFNDFSEGQVDLYYNDMVALQKSKQNILSTIKSQQRLITNQQRQINSKKVFQPQNQNYQILQGIRNLGYEQNQQNYDGENGFFKEMKSAINNQVNFETVQTQIQMVLVLRLIYILEEKKADDLQELIEADRTIMVKILATKFKRISFVFFEGGRSPALYSIYKKLISHLSQSETITTQTLETIQYRLQPYFRNAIDRQGEQSNIIVAKYLSEQRQSKQMICHRYEQGQKLFYNQGVSETHFHMCNYQAQQDQFKRRVKKIGVQLSLDTKADIRPVLAQLLLAIDRVNISFVKEMICFHVAKIDYYRVWAEVTQAQLGHLQIVLNNLGLKLYFQSNTQYIKIGNSKKYAFYLQLFLQFYLNKVQQYHLNVIIGNMILKQVHCQQKIDVNVFRELYTIGNNQKQKINQINQIINNISDDDMIKYFRYYPHQYFQVFQLCLNIIDRLIKTLDGFLPYEANVQMNITFTKLMDSKIRSCLLIQLVLLKNIGEKQPQQTIYVTALYLNKILITKCVEFRRRTLCQKLSKAQQFNDFYSVVESYENLYNVWDLMKFDQEPLKSEVQKFRLKEYLERVMKRVLQGSDSWYKIQKQLFEIIIYTALIPFEEYEKFNLIKKYYEVFKRQSSRKDRQTKSSYAQYYAVSKTFKLALQIDDFNTIINIFEFVESKKSYVMNPRFTYSIYYFFRKCNNSKKIRQCIKTMSTFRKMFLNDDVLHYDFQQRITEVALSTNNNSKEHLQNFQIIKPQKQADELLSIITQKQDQQYFLTTIMPSPLRYRACIQLLKQWKTVIKKVKKNKQLQTKLFNLRFILKRTFYSPGNITVLFKYLSKQYQLEIQNYQNTLIEKIEFLRQRKKIQSQIWKFFGQQCFSEDQYWKKVKLSFILLSRSRLLSQITKNIDIIQSHQVDFILKEWQVFDNAIRKVASVEFVKNQATLTSKYPSLMTYYQIQTKVKRVIYLHSLREKKQQQKFKKVDFLEEQQYAKIVQNSNKKNEIIISNKKTNYINVFIQYLKRAIIRYQKLSNKIYSPSTQFKYFQTDNVIKSANSILSFRCQQPFMDLLADCCHGVVSQKDVQNTLLNQKILKPSFSQGFTLQNELKKSFFDIVQSQSIHMFFYLYHFRIRFLQTLIQLGAKLILQGKKQQQMGCYFLTFVFYHICQFVKKHNCSSYSYLVVGVINTLQQRMLSRIFQHIKKDCSKDNVDQQNPSSANQTNTDIKNLTSKLRLITLFQRDIIKFLIEQAKESKIEHAVLILLSCERIKFQIILFLIKNILLFENLQENTFDSELKAITKIQYVICSYGHKLQYLAKIFFKHTFYCYMIMMTLSNKKFNISEFKLSSWLAFLTIRNEFQLNQSKKDNIKSPQPQKNHSNFYRYLQIKHFRSIRRISHFNQEKQQKRRLVFFLQQKYYHLIFQSINQQSLRKIPILKQKLQETKNTSNNKQWNVTSIKVMNFLRQKVNKYLQNSCSNQL